MVKNEEEKLGKRENEESSNRIDYTQNFIIEMHKSK